MYRYGSFIREKACKINIFISHAQILDTFLCIIITVYSRILKNDTFYIHKITLIYIPFLILCTNCIFGIFWHPPDAPRNFVRGLSEVFRRLIVFRNLIPDVLRYLHSLKAIKRRTIHPTPYTVHHTPSLTLPFSFTAAYLTTGYP